MPLTLFQPDASTAPDATTESDEARTFSVFIKQGGAYVPYLANCLRDEAMDAAEHLFQVYEMAVEVRGANELIEW